MTSFSNVWNGGYENEPAGSVAANTLDTVIQGLKVDIRQRIEVEHYLDGDAEDGVHKFPDYNKTTRDAIGTPKDGQLIRRSDARSIDIYDGSDWIEYQAHSTGDYKMAAYDNSADPGWVKADGASYLRTGIYEDLFDLIGVEYGNADATHFNVPDMSGKFPIGIDAGGDTDFDAMGETGGDKVKTLLEEHLPEHAHSGGDLTTDDPGDHAHDIDYNNNISGLGGTNAASTRSSKSGETSGVVVAAGAHTHVMDSGTTGVGDGTAEDFDIMPPFITVQWYIKL